MERFFILLFFTTLPIGRCFAFTDTAFIIQIASNTSEQLVRMEKLLSKANEQVKYTKELKEKTDMLREQYDNLDDIQSTLISLQRVKDRSVQDLEEINNAIEDVQGQKERVKDLMEKTRQSQKEAALAEKKINELDSSADKQVAIDKGQISKSYGAGAVGNQQQVTSQNTAMINSKLTETNFILKEEAKSNLALNKLYAADYAHRLKKEETDAAFMDMGKSSQKRGKND